MGFHLPYHGEDIIPAEYEVPCAACWRGVPTPLQANSSLCSVMKPSKHTDSPERALVESCLHCPWALRRMGGALFLPPLIPPPGKELTALPDIIDSNHMTIEHFKRA